MISPVSQAVAALQADAGGTGDAMAGDNRPIGVFDSGLGGLTVARAIAHAMPHESVCYIGDTARCPYGVRDESEVRSFVLQVGRWLTRQNVKVMVIACNTATAAGLSLAQQTFDVPVIGVIVPGARAAIHSTRSRRVGVLATELTIRSGAYARAIQDFDAGVEVFGCPASCFVDIVEDELATAVRDRAQAGDDATTGQGGARWLSGVDVFDTPEVNSLVRQVTAPLRGHDIDTVVLGCTHFPLLSGPIRRAMGEGVRVVSSAEEITRELAEMLARREERAAATAVPRHRFATTSTDVAAFAYAGSFVFGQTLGAVENVSPQVLEGASA